MHAFHIERPCPEWHGAAWRGRLTGAGAARQVLAIVGPEVPSPDAAARALKAARPMLGRRDPGVLPLLAVVPIDQRLAWVYERVSGLGLGHAVGGDDPPRLPLPVAAEIVAATAHILVGVGPRGLAHPGPVPDDVLVTADGGVHIAGFTGPFPPSPAMREPHGEEGPLALVYRLGVLLAALVTGHMPNAVADPSAHESMVRRTLIRAMARPDQGFEGRYHDWLVGMLSWTSSERPALTRVPEGLLQIGRDAGKPSLETWARETLPGLRSRAGATSGRTGGSTPRREQRPDPWVDSKPPDATEERPVPYIGDGMQTVPGLPLSPLPEEDDHTAESAPLGTRMPPEQHRSRIPAERGTIPVGVGPPPEAVKERPKLPSGFLDAARNQPREEPAPARPSARVVALAAICLVLIVCGACFAIYLF